MYQLLIQQIVVSLLLFCSNLLSLLESNTHSCLFNLHCYLSNLHSSLSNLHFYLSSSWQLLLHVNHSIMDGLFPIWVSWILYAPHVMHCIGRMSTSPVPHPLIPSLANAVQVARSSFHNILILLKSFPIFSPVTIMMPRTSVSTSRDTMMLWP